jgi:proteasome lid subunit RPN8/RPN11
LTIVLKRSMVDEIAEHSLQEYPREACGIMAGERRGKTRIVKRVFKTRNRLTSPSRYEIDPEDQLKAFQEAEKMGLEVVGFYHSHPYWESSPSFIDRSLAFYKGYSYAIYSVVTRSLASYIWDGSTFVEEPVKII